MSGNSGRAVAPHTLLVTIGDRQFAVSQAEHDLIRIAIAAGGAVNVRGPQVRVARALSMFGDLTDDGALSVDGERWTFTIRSGVALYARHHPRSDARPGPSAREET